MRRQLIAAATAIAIFTTGQAVGQTVGVAPAETVVIEPTQRTKIKEYVVKERVSPVAVRERVVVGATVPAEVLLRAVPEDWGPTLTKYRYVYTDNHVALVEPSSRRVIHIID